jgi:P27 family predicted phage terminase small subunit
VAKKGRPAKPRSRRAAEGGSEKRGDVSHRPLPAPVVVAGRNVPIEPPDDLPESARAVWVFIVAELAGAGIVDKVDLPQLRAFCIQVAREQDAGKLIDQPFDEQDSADLDATIQRMEAIATHLDARIATALRNSLPLEAKDIRAAESYADKLTKLREFRTAKRAVGNMVTLGSTGQLTEHPMLATERASANILLRFAQEFAMTPTSRARLGLAVLEGKSLERELADDLGPTAKR